MANDKTREDFHSWAQSSPVNLKRSDIGDSYESSVAAFAFRAYQAATQHSAARISELEAEVQALRRDAERLDWVEKQEGAYRGLGSDVADCPFWEVCGSQGQTMREAIDAAIEAERGGA